MRASSNTPQWKRMIGIGLIFCALHTVCGFDFNHHWVDPELPGSRWGQTALVDPDRDGDLALSTGLSGGNLRWYLWENVRGDASSLERHILLDKNLGTHETRAGDMDGDGDIDLVGQLWWAHAQNENHGANHIDSLESLHPGQTKTKVDPVERNPTFHYIDTSFENASPLWYELDEHGRVQVFLNYDQERESPNRANGHWHFKIQAESGSKHTIVLNNLNNVWNGKPGVPVSDRTICKVSEDGKVWRTIETNIEHLDQLVFEVEMRASHLFVAHVEPYRISDLEALKEAIADHPLVGIKEIGSTVQGRSLEIIRVGHDRAPYRVFLRGRAHPWEPGGNWVLQGLIKSLLASSPENEIYLNQYAVYILPMANKDGVAEGKTRFNMMGMDLNRKWDKPADPELCPENYYLEEWFQWMIHRGTPIHVAIDLHNDQSGRIHVSRPNIDLDAYLKRMERYETLMRQHTWFTEGSTGGTFRNPGTIGEGLLERYGITAFVQELNANWIEGLQQHTSGKNWELLGSQMRHVFHAFFNAESTNSTP